MNNSKILSLATFALFSILVTSSLVPVFASPYALQNPSGTVNATNATSGNMSPTPTSPLTGQATGAITVTTDKTSYNLGDTIDISGHTQDYITDTPITVIVKSPIGSIVKFDQIPLGSDRTYFYSITATDGALWQSGTYSVMVQFGSQDRTAQTTFQFTGQTTSNPPSSPNQPPQSYYAKASDGTTVVITTTAFTSGQPLVLGIEFKDSNGNFVKHQNYAITIIQDNNVVLSVPNGHTHTGTDTQTTQPLSSTDQISIKMTLLGVGLPTADPSDLDRCKR